MSVALTVAAWLREAGTIRTEELIIFPSALISILSGIGYILTKHSTTPPCLMRSTPSFVSGEDVFHEVVDSTEYKKQS